MLQPSITDVPRIGVFKAVCTHTSEINTVYMWRTRLLYPNTHAPVSRFMPAV